MSAEGTAATTNTTTRGRQETEAGETTQTSAEGTAATANTTTAAVEGVKVPKWAKEARSTFLEGQVGNEPAWKECVELWWALEASTKFASPVKGFRTDGRPEEIHTWIKYARKKKPAIPDMDRQRVAEGDQGSVELLRKPGANGFLSVLAGLKWWWEGEGATEEWIASFEDVTLVTVGVSAAGATQVDSGGAGSAVGGGGARSTAGGGSARSAAAAPDGSQGMEGRRRAAASAGSAESARCRCIATFALHRSSLIWRTGSVRYAERGWEDERAASTGEFCGGSRSTVVWGRRGSAEPGGFLSRAALEGQRVAPGPGLIGGSRSPSCTSNNVAELELVDLYMVDPREHSAESAPFMQWMSFGGPQGEKVCVLALFDSGAQVGAIDRTFFEEARRRMGFGIAPKKCLRMADGTRVDSSRHWEGEIEIQGVRVQGGFEVFDSKGGWKVLLGKPLQALLGAIHDMKADVVTLSANRRKATLHNQNPSVAQSLNGGEIVRDSPVRRVPPTAVPSDTDAAGNTGAFIVEVDEDEELGEEGPGEETGAQGGDEGFEMESDDEFEDAVEAMGDEEVEELFGDDEMFVDAMEELEDGEGEKGEMTRRDEEGSSGDASKREASTGVKSSAIPPARRVLFDILPTWMQTDGLLRDAWRTETEHPCLTEDAGNEGSGEVAGNEMTRTNEREIGDTPMRGASTGVQSSAMPPARRVLFDILPAWSSVNLVSQAPTATETIFTRATDPLSSVKIVLQEVRRM
ncbi:hypothetical protein B0H13DRAFT_2385138 [Mycena leptocephala]|nr:hypothetical protein B0H13DRAFT_2385138 [Mycena leptocephala]